MMSRTLPYAPTIDNVVMSSAPPKPTATRTRVAPIVPSNESRVWPNSAPIQPPARDNSSRPV